MFSVVPTSSHRGNVLFFNQIVLALAVVANPSAGYTPETFVSDGSLTILVAEIRDVLNDDAEQPQFIRTVRRFGYGFCAPVTAQDVSPLPSSGGGG